MILFAKISMVISMLALLGGMICACVAIVDYMFDDGLEDEETC